MIKIFLFVFVLLLCQAIAFAQARVTFITDKVSLVKASTQNLFLAGDFNNWNAADTAWKMKPDLAGRYQLVKMLPKGNISFKITKGSWESVESESSGKDIANRDVIIAHDTIIVMNVQGWKDNHPVEPKKHTASANVHITSENFDMPQLGRKRRVWIYLPADYVTSRKKYPVVYMHDGQNLFDEYTSGYGEWEIDEIMDKLPAKDESIIVGIDHGGENRIMEYDPYNSKYGKGRGDDYVEFIVKTLKPYIDANYRTEKNAQHTTIAGSSMGGLIAMYAILKYPNIFGNAGVFSPAFWIAPDIYQYAQQSKLSSKSRIYFVCGDSEDKTMVSDMQKMVEIIQAKGINENNIPTVIMPGAKHNEKQWNTDFPAFYNWLLRGY
ncbi:alpha/beta hydrolase [Mucilaginibacter sp.]